MTSHWKVTQIDSGLSLLQFVKARVSLSGRKLKKLIESNQCHVNGNVERFASHRLRSGDRVGLHSIELEPIPQSIEKSRILYEDDSLFFYNKPSGITSDETGLASLFPEYYLVHRLDKETTGVIVFAKTVEKKKELENLFRHRKVGKVYLALVDGVPKMKKGTIKKAIGRLGSNLWGIVKPSEGKSAQTDWEREKVGTSATLLQCYPRTGRTHQIRLHMKDIGHPILGDYHYERNYTCPHMPKRFMLHALELTIGEITVKAPIPDDFKEMMEQVL